MQQKVFRAQPLRSSAVVRYLSSSFEIFHFGEGVIQAPGALLLPLLLRCTAQWTFSNAISQQPFSCVTSHTSHIYPKPSEMKVVCRRYASVCPPHDGMLRRWRLQAETFRALHLRCTASGLEQKGRDVFECRQNWYQRQLQAQTLFPVDLIPLAQRLPLNRSSPPQGRRATRIESQMDNDTDAMTDAFISCCDSPLCDAKVLRSIFVQLSGEQQCSILSRCLSYESHGSLPLICQCTEEALSNPTFSPAHWIRVLSSANAGAPAHPIPVIAIFKNVFSCRTSAFASTDDARNFIATALSLMERQRVPFESIVDCLKACGLHYEACAYASPSSSFAPFPFPSSSSAGELDGWGYGPVLHSMWALPKPPLKWFSALRSKMPPALQRYSTLTLLHAALRKCGGVLCAEDDVWRHFTAELLSPLEAASALHFLLFQGNTFTSRLLLDHCHTALQVLTLMRYSQGAEHTLTFQALEKLLSMRTGERVIVHLGLESWKRHTQFELIFDAQGGSCEASTRQPELREGHEAGLLTQTLPLGPHDRNLLQQYLRLALPHSVLVRGERSLAQVLAAIPSSAVGHVANSLPTIHSDALSWWASLYLKGHNVDGALAVLAVIAARGCLPHMVVLVELLECTQGNTESFAHSVRMLERNFPDVSDTVLRAFVERTVTWTSMTRATQPSNATAQAVQTLKSFAIMSLPKLSAQHLKEIAAHDSPDAVHAVLALARRQCSSPGRTTKTIPLDVAAIRGIAAAGRLLKYRVRVSVVALAEGDMYVGWWSSASRPLQSLTRLAYSSQDLSLWPWVEREALTCSFQLSASELHRSVRVVALGSRDPMKAVAVWNAVKERIGHGNEGRKASRNVLRAMDNSEAYTLACVYAVCLAEGQMQLAPHLTHSRNSSSQIPPLLAALVALRTAPLRLETEARTGTMRSNKTDRRSVLGRSKGTLRWRRAQKRAVRKTKCSLLLRLPTSLQRLVHAAGPDIVDSFSIPEGYEACGRRQPPET